MAKNEILTAAYCRVSTGSDLQDGSYEAQCAYYRRLITGNPALVLVDVYGDQGKSGRSMKGRKELSRLIRDCEAGKVDLVLTKSISRFARNMMECVETIRHLSALGVRVHFEKEGLDTRTMGGELMLGILAAIAQEESNSIALNMQWSRRKHVEQGRPWEAARYGYVSVGREHQWVVIPQEALVVRRAFYMAGMCFPYLEIVNALTKMEAARGGARIWSRATLVNLLRSRVYIGDYLSNKECRLVDEQGNVKRVKNKGYIDQILIEGHHPALVSRALYDAVQTLLDHGTLWSHRSRFTPEQRAIMSHGRQLAQKEAELWQNG